MRHIKKIAALYVEKNGVYSDIPVVDLWDIDRDARRYTGPYPIVAHPPCQRWGNLAYINYARWGGEHNKPGNDGGCFLSALLSLKLYGGVLEHPAKSHAWEHFNLPHPEKGAWVKRIGFDGWVCEVWQSAYGHRANKATWLAYCGKRSPFDFNWNRPRGKYQIGFQDQRGKSRNKPTLNKKEANATPIKFRDALIELALWSTGEHDETN